MRWRSVSVVAGLLIAGCATEYAKEADPPTTEASPEQLPPLPDPCVLLTAADFKQTLGISVQEPPLGTPPTSDDGAGSCAWLNADLGQTVSPLLDVYRDARWCDKWSGSPSVREVDALGDAAVWDEQQSAVCVTARGMSLSLQVEGATAADVLDLARIAVSRL